jgi:hypothetical protein
MPEETVCNRIVRVGGQSDQNTDVTHLLRLLRSHGKRPCDRGSTEHTEKLTPSHLTIPALGMVAAQTDELKLARSQVPVMRH